MSDGGLAALIGMLRPKSRIASSPADVWRAMQVCNNIDNLWESKCKVKSLIICNYLYSVISSNNITVPPPFLALLLNEVRKSLVPCLLVMNTIHF